MTSTVRQWRSYEPSRWGQVHVRHAAPATGQQHAVTAGAALLLLHESPLSSRVWQELLPIAGQYRHVLAPDTPGYGLSDPPPNDQYEIPDYAAAIVDVLVAQRISEVVVCGVHTGASLAIEIARQFDGVIGVVLTGVALLSDDERARFIRDWTPPIELTTEGAQFEWATQRYHRIWGEDTPAWMLNLAIGDVLSVWDRYSWAYQAAFRYDPEPALRALEQPTLLLDAEHDLLADKDPLVQAMVADCRTVLIPDLRGQIHLRAPEETARFLEEFSESCSP